MKSNLTLIGMPGSGKSTVGVILAKRLGLDFVDTDLLIQSRQQRPLQEIVDKQGHLALRAIEQEEILQLNLTRHVIATGGSAAYSERAMHHLQAISTIVFLELDFTALQHRIRDFASRGIAKAANQSFADLFDERQPLYRRYADFSIDCHGLDQEEVADLIIAELGG